MCRHRPGSPKSGPIRDRDFPFAIGVLAEGEPMLIGIVFGTRRTNDGLAIWRLTIHGVVVPGQWIVVDREFQPIVAGGISSSASSVAASA
jgi:hypothetical protein